MYILTKAEQGESLNAAAYTVASPDNAKEFIVEYPKVKKDCSAFVIVTLKNGRKFKAMFYWNGKEPRFASYGANVTSEVVAWEYRK